MRRRRTRRPDSASASLSGTCRRPRRKRERRGELRLQVRLHAAGFVSHAVAAAERERLVPDSARRQLRRDGRPVRAADLRRSQELRRAGQRGGSRQRRLHGQGGKQPDAASLHAQVRRHGSGRDRNGVAAAERERLVPGSPRRQLRRDGRPVGAADLRSSQELRRAGQRGGSRQRQPARTRRETAARRSLTLKYDATAPVATATASRQPNANGWYRAPLDVSFAATDALSGPPTCDAAKSYGGPDSGGGSRQRRLRGQGGKQRRGIARAQVRRHGSGRDRNSVAAAERERLVPDSPRRQLRRDGRACRGRRPATQPRTTAGRTAGRRSSAAPARTRRETAARHPSRSSTTRPAPRQRSRPRASRTPTGGSTPR